LNQDPRYQGSAQAAEGWTVSRATQPSRLFGANGIRTHADGRIYVAQVAGSQVSAIDVDTGVIEAISPRGGKITAPDDLAFDEAGNMYFTEITEDRVTMLSPNGEFKVISGGINVANPIMYHQGRLIAGELDMAGRIMELDRNGGAPRIIVENVPMANAFDVGPDGKLYFPAQAANEIWRVDLDGGQPEVVVKDLGVPDAVKFHPDGYIVSTQVGSGQVLKIDPRSGDREVLAEIGPGLDNVAFVGKRTFVSHIRGSIHEIVAPGQAKPLIDAGLQWPLGLAWGDGELFVADGMFCYTLRPGAEPELVAHLFSPGFPGWVRCAAASGPGEWLVTTANGHVAKWRPGAAESDFLAEGYDKPMGIAVGQGGAIVLAEAGTGKVHLLEGGNATELGSGLDKPMGVAVGPDGTVFVSEGNGGRVVKLSGGKGETVIDGLRQPEGIAIAGGKLYVLDVATREVVESDLSGGNRKTIASGLPVGAPDGPAPKQLGGVGNMCGPMWTFGGLAAGSDGTIYVSSDAEGSVLALKPE
jgi:sugar lactone lactonase YvrE